MQYLSIAISVAVLTLTGCAPKAPLQVEAPAAAIRSAEELGAGEVPQAALHLQLAKEEMEAAAVLHEKGQEEEAESLLKRAEADAELAVVLSRADAEKKDAEAAVERVRVLRAENQK